MHYTIKSKHSPTLFNETVFNTLTEASQYLESQPPAVRKVYEVFYEGPSEYRRMIFEGFMENDLEGLLKPVISFDEYVSKHKENIVIAFYIQDEPLAVEPLKLFCDQAEGVLETDMSDSDTYENCSIVYVEFLRDPKNIKLIAQLIEDVGKVANLDPSDFMVRLSNFDKEYEYSEKLLSIYFNKAMKNV